MSGIYGVYTFQQHLPTANPVLDNKSQPTILNEDRSVWLIADAQIDNASVLKEGLQAQGHQVGMGGKGEVIVHLYEEYGLDCVKHLRGAFAFALWDSQKNIFFLARDRFGIRPLYYSFVDGAVVFASQMRDILSHPGIRKIFCPDRLPLYFTFMNLPAPYTFFKGVEKMVPATTLLVRPDGSSQKVEYWNYLAGPRRESFRTEKDCVDGLIGTLEEVVASQSKEGDAGGVFLSGGVDSSLIAGLAAKCQHPLRTFTSGLSDNEWTNEFHFARRVAGPLGAEHHEVMVNKDDFHEGLFRQLISLQEEPALRPGSIAYYLLSQLAKKEGSDFVFIGPGADFLFGLSVTRKFMFLKRCLDFFSSMPKFLQASMMELFRLQDPIGFKYEILRRSREQQAHYWGEFDMFYLSDIDSLLNRHRCGGGGIDPHAVISPLVSDFLTSRHRHDYAVFLSYVDLQLTAPGVLMRFDKMCSVNGLIAKYPYHDHVFVDFVIGCCGKFNEKRNPVKYLLKKAAERMVPKECVYRKKQALGRDLWMWYLSSLKDFSRMRQLVRVFNQQHGYFNEEYIDRLFLNANSGRSQNKIWQIYAFVLWFEEWVSA